MGPFMALSCKRVNIDYFTLQFQIFVIALKQSRSYVDMTPLPDNYQYR
jgi:hypothetical protein